MTRDKKSSDQAGNVQETDTTNYRADLLDKDCGATENNKCLINTRESCPTIDDRGENISCEESNASSQEENSASVDDFLCSATKYDNNEKKLYLCDLCGKIYGAKSRLNTHYRSHTGEQPYVCDSCGKCFASNSKLKLHQNTHTGVKPFVCEYCDKRYSRSYILNVHIRSHTHPGEKPFQCQFCAKRYLKKFSLKNHIIRHHPESYPIQC